MNINLENKRNDAAKTGATSGQISQISQNSLISGKLRPNAGSSFQTNSKSINMKGIHHSVSGSTSQTSVMVLDKKLINFNTNSTISQKQTENSGENSKGASTTSNRVKITSNTQLTSKDPSRKLLGQNQPVKAISSSISVNQKSQTATVSSTDVDPDRQPVAEDGVENQIL